MDKPSMAPRSRAQTRHDLITLIDSFLTMPVEVVVKTRYGTSTFLLEPLPFADPPDQEPVPPRLSVMDRNLLEAAALLPPSATAEELAKRAGYVLHSGVRAALSRLREYGFLGGPRKSPGYTLTALGRAALAS
jgi:hypothetical protein